MDIWYLAHPVSRDDKYTTEQNLDHALKIQKILFEAGIVTVMPWHSYCLTYGSAEGERLAKCLKMDCQIVKLLGKLILVGHKLSYGMAVEFDALDGEFIDLIGVPDKHLAEAAHAHVTSFKSNG